MSTYNIHFQFINEYIHFNILMSTYNIHFQYIIPNMFYLYLWKNVTQERVRNSRGKRANGHSICESPLAIQVPS